MQHFRKISSLEEDFAVIGIAKKNPGSFFPSEVPDAKVSIEEGLTVQRTKKMSPSEKAQAKRYRQRNKSKLARQSAVRERKPQHQVRQAKVARLKGDRAAGPRRRFVLNQDLSNMRNEMKALQELRKLHNANSPKTNVQLIEALKRVSKNAQTLCRKFAVLEEIKYGQLKESIMNIPIEHPESEYGWENPDAPNITVGNKDGNATDYASHSKLKGNVKAEDDMDPSDNQEWWADVGGDDEATDDMDAEVDADDMDMDDSDIDMDDSEIGSEDDLDAELSNDDDDDEMDLDFDVSDDEEAFESKKVDLSYEMSRLRTEAEDVMQKLKTSVLSPADAGQFVKDMVSYLGGAMKAYLDLAAQISSEYTAGGYAGQGAPADAAGKVDDNGNVNKYAGVEIPAEAGESPEIYKLNV